MSQDKRCLNELSWAEKLEWLELRAKPVEFGNYMYNPEHRKWGYLKNTLQQSCHLKFWYHSSFELAHQNGSLNTTKVAAKFRIKKY